MSVVARSSGHLEGASMPPRKACLRPQEAVPAHGGRRAFHQRPWGLALLSQWPKRSAWRCGPQGRRRFACRGNAAPGVPRCDPASH